ncbi:paladin isoform X1 [Rousettus aegyptiacus]|uniref:Paladin n=1 Tax=Rousettus aegyptiacus TaxID=9407 RepID=A0A7J8GDJ4_ROUAE|nr:paladin isoform X1 [Rousettus aegyptiacus]XP_015976495.2 paladin isoform X1 [Rousettus aegyptiacus]XP_015976496.2 paladin isoform X1 [Rousettus aegyptiacus]XP_015976497.2 paladin isoform X1 [Rousettus aegyptiacus]XP_015976499.2 paladin isoform X1 [Rousettus aegyptiacus]XP_036078497.1 paladin isoform X1 [Rousettus aegyptiacus]XP_036078499.1 paladin isoform X1 [Rousettus aegyptiacus]XP_036078500.1 paladin isoform X1 [Rousettus aegyptiacus]KAF6457996.1 phosphatase domain containing paladin 
MGTTASTAQQTVSATASFEGLQGGGTMDGRHSVSVHSFQTTSLHNSKAKSIIPNKVAPVVITYNCKEEFQIHDELLKAHYTLGRLSDTTPEHYLVQGRYFLVRDVAEKMDVLGTVQSCGAPNFRQVRGGLTVFGMGQPSLLGFRQVLQKLQKDGHKECIIFCVREEPVLFLRADEDFVPYTPRDKQNLHENLQGLGPGVQAESLELAIRKEIHDFAQLSESTYQVYHNTEDLRGEPHTVAIRGEDDVHVTEEVYKRPLFLQPTYRYHRLPLPEQGAPLEAQFDAFVSVIRETPSLLLLRDTHGSPPALLFSCQTGLGRTNLGMVLGTLILFHHSGSASRPEAGPLKTKPLPMEQLQVIQSFLHAVPQGRKMVEEVDRAITACAELHDLKEVVLENQRKLEGIRPESPDQGSGRRHSVWQRALWSLERYFYLILFNYYLHEQYPLAFALSFSRWLCAHPELYRLPVTLSSAGPLAPGDFISKGFLGADDLISLDALSTVREMDVANFRRVSRMPIYGTAQPSAKALGSILAYLTDAKRKLRQVVWVNLREEAVLECDGHTHSLRQPGPPMTADQLENLETQLKAHLSMRPPGAEGPRTHRFQTCLTTQEVFSQHHGACPGLTYHRIPVPDFCAPREEDFDQLLEVLRAALAKDAGTGFVFSCLSGQGRTTTAMVVAVLTFWHIRGFPEVGEEELVSVPDAKFTMGEFEVVMKVVQLLPDGHRVKKEVDAALDTVSETMTPMHYHLREIIICTYRQAKAAKSEQEVRRLQLRSLQYLERYVYLVLFNAYLHLEKDDSWKRPFSTWMREVASKAGVYEILNQLGFPELESVEDQPFSRLRCRWQEQSLSLEPFTAGDSL